MAHLEGERTWVVQGRAVQLPVSFDARATVAVFRADRSAVADLLSGTPLRPAVLGRQAVSVLLCAHYARGDLGSYDEVGVGVLARDAIGRIGLYLCDLPVTQEFTLEAGQDIWGLPKWLMTAELALSDRETTTSISDRGQPVVRATLRYRGLPVAFPLPVPVPTWAYPDRGAQAGVLLRGALLLGLSRVRVGHGELTLELGAHAMAERMRLLGMTSGPWVCVTARIHGTLGASRATVAG